MPKELPEELSNALYSVEEDVRDFYEGKYVKPKPLNVNKQIQNILAVTLIITGFSSLLGYHFFGFTHAELTERQILFEAWPYLAVCIPCLLIGFFTSWKGTR